MANVPISKNLMEEVRNGIRNMQHRDEFSLKNVAFPSLTEARLEQLVVPAAWGEHYHLKALIPASWCPRADRAYIKVQDDREGMNAQEWTNAYDFNGNITVPPRSGSSIHIKLTLTDAPELTEWVNYSIEAAEVRQRWDDTRSKVCNFLESCKSLNEGLKLWPDLAHYIPKEYLDRVGEKRAKQEKEVSRAMEMLKSLDTEQLTANVVIARMAVPV
jgi:hypothetical protein